MALGGCGNTRDRVEGFRAGFVEAFPGEAVFHAIDGRGLLKEVVRQAADSFSAHPGINVVFGVNDHTILGTLDVAGRLGRRVSGYSVGGEGAGVFDELSRGRALKAVLRLLPRGRRPACRRHGLQGFRGRPRHDEVMTPAEIVTAQTLPDYYERHDGQWRLRGAVLDADVRRRMSMTGRPSTGRRIGFMLHYPSHEWYRGLGDGDAGAGRRGGRDASLPATPRTRWPRSCAPSAARSAGGGGTGRRRRARRCWSTAANARAASPRR